MRIWTTVIGQRLDEAENTRSMLLCSELLRRGHDVVMWTSAYDHIRKTWRKEWLESRPGPYHLPNGLEVRFMQGCGYKANVGVRRLLDHWLVARDFRCQARELPQPDAIVASLPDHLTAAAAVQYGRNHGIATVVDVRDKWPDIFVDHLKNPLLRGAARLGLAFEGARAARALKRADAVVAMMHSMMAWGLTKGQRQPTWRDRVFYLTTSPKNFDVPRPTLPNGSEVIPVLSAIGSRVTFAFVGTFNRTQHPLLILDALDRLKASGTLDPSRFAVVIAGDGVDAPEVWRRAAQLENVYCTGWLNIKETSVLLAASQVGLLVMNFPSPAFNNKAFAYLASGLPIINGATGDLEDIIERRRIGVNIRAGSPDHLADAIANLVVDYNLRSDLTENARQLFVEQFDRDTNYRAYADHIEQITLDLAGRSTS